VSNGASAIAGMAIPGAPSERHRPLLAPWYRPVRQHDRLLFEHAGTLVELEGGAVHTLMPSLLPLLDGDHTVGEIVEALGRKVEPSVRKALAQLDEHGLLTDGPAVEGDAAPACYVAVACPGATPASALEALSGSRVAVTGSSRLTTELARLLGSAGIATDRVDDASRTGASLVVAAPSPTETAMLTALNERRLHDGIPWVQVLPDDGRFTAVGPLFVPGQTACYQCFLIRRAATSGFESEFPLVDAHPVRASTPEPIGTIAAGLAALICIRWLGARDPTLPGWLYAFESRATPTLTRHRVLRVPRCSTCGAPPPPPNPWFKDVHGA
jgi:bacteriocin biosynthesis cyclodehydratase domain-containing protein